MWLSKPTPHEVVTWGARVESGWGQCCMERAVVRAVAASLGREAVPELANLGQLAPHRASLPEGHCFDSGPGFGGSAGVFERYDRLQESLVGTWPNVVALQFEVWSGAWCYQA